MNKHYETARQIYADWGVDTEAALRRMDEIPLSINCWQLDDLTGLEDFDAKLTGGIAATGNAPGKPRSVEEYFDSLNRMLELVPGAKHLALHSVYPLTNGVKVPRNQLRPEHFAPWVDYAREKGIGLDFNPTYFSHPMSESGWTLSSADEGVREFWVEHGIACRRIGAYFGRELGETCVTNHWIPDGSKDTRVDTLGPRERLIDSLNRIFAEPIDRRYNVDSVEGKVFGLGVESYTVGSHEFYTNYALTTGKAIVCMDTGHYHPTESVAAKLTSYLAFGQEIMMHLSRCVRWDSDHVAIANEDTVSIMQELKRCRGFDKVHLGLDFFDASIDRVAASVIGARSVKKALLTALLEPTEHLLKAEAENDLTRRLALLEEFRFLPAGIVFEEYCERHNMPGANWLETLR
nr:L-rhamnose isomerase [uncultured Oscillibacter sp.]